MDWSTMSKEQKQREVARMWRIRRTVLRMVHDRKYLVSQKEMDVSLEEFTAQFVVSDTFDREKLVILFQKKDDPSDQIFVFFSGDPQLKINPIKQYIQRMKEVQAQRAIIIYKGKITGLAKQVLSEAKSVELFREEELLVNITEHSLVPKHIVLSDEEKAVLLSK